MDLIKK